MKTKIRRLFCMPDGMIRPFWKRFLAVGGYAAAFYGVLHGCAAVFAALFKAWGLTNDNLVFAPLWARQIVIGHTGFSYAMAYAASGTVGILISGRWWKPQHENGCRWMGTVLGFSFASVLTAAAIVLDSIRLENPLAEPCFALSQAMALAAILLGKFSVEILSKRILFDSSKKRFGGYLCVCVLAILLNANWMSPISIVNAMLLGAVGCALYEWGGLIASAGLQAAWTVFCSLIFGWPGMTFFAPAVYSVYHVSDAWLTGGNSGPMNGLAAMLALLVAVAVLLRADFARIFIGGRKKNG